MANVIKQFLKDNYLCGGGALLAKHMLQSGVDPTTARFTLAFTFDQEGPRKSLFLEAVSDGPLHKNYGYSGLLETTDPLKDPNTYNYAQTELRRSETEIIRIRKICGIER